MSNLAEKRQLSEVSDEGVEITKKFHLDQNENENDDIEITDLDNEIEETVEDFKVEQKFGIC